MREIEKFIENDLTNKAKDINRFTQEANEQEFIVCRFFIGWSVASIGALVMFYLQNINVESPKTNMLLLYLRAAVIPLAFSIICGILDHLLFVKNLLKKSTELDKKIRDTLNKIIEKGDDAVSEIKESLIKEYRQESAVLIGFKGFLYLQMALFLLGILIIGYSVLFLGL